MFDKPQATHALGLEIDAYSLKGALLSFIKGQPILEQTFDLPVEPEQATANVKPLYTNEQRQFLLELAEKNLVATFLDAQNTLIRPLELKIKKEKDLDAVLAFQAEPLLPYPGENALVDKIILSKDKEGSKLTIVAARKDHVDLHLKQWNALEIEPEIVSSAPFALSLFSHQYITSEDPYYTLHIGLAESLCIFTEKGKLLSSQNIPFGVENLIEAYAQQQNIDLATAHQEFLSPLFDFEAASQKPTLQNAIETMRIAITRTVYSLAKQSKGKEVNAFFITGQGAVIPGLKEGLCRSLNKSILPFAQTDLLPFALPIGAALSALPKSDDQINFRQGEYAFPNPWKRLKQPLILYTILCLGMALALTLFGKAYISYQHGQIKRQYLELLSVMHKPYTQFEKEYASKAPMDERSSGEEIKPLNSLTPDEIKKRLAFLEKEIQATPQSYPLQPNVPLVSDVLAWLVTNPIVAGEKGSTEGLQIESFNYTLVKRPEPSKKQEKYQVKVELEFSSPTPKIAREFHDALIAPNDFVDPKAEIKWNSNRDKYRTSFYLKDKTMYPNL